MQSKTSTQSKHNFLSLPVPLWVLIVICLLWSGIIGYLYLHSCNGQATISKLPANEPQGNAMYPFLNPKLEDKPIASDIRPFRDEVEAYINKEIKEGKVTSVSVYFRSLNDGYMFGINEHDNYRPASLLKVPVMMAYLKMAQDSPQILDKQILFDKKVDEVPNKVANHIQLGNSYSIRDLIKQMIVYSDNDASNLLDSHLNKKLRNQIYKDFGISVPDKPEVWEDYLSISDYMRFFRVLYNASYLNKEMSEYALKTLSESYFKDGIVLGVGDTKVAHKYGEWFYNGMHQLHDCGIVYVNNQPYILGVMTKGKNLYDISSVIQGVSNTVYNNVQKGI